MQRQLKLKGGIGGDTAACAQSQLKASARQAQLSRAGAVIMLLVRSLRSVMLLYT